MCYYVICVWKREKKMSARDGGKTVLRLSKTFLVFNVAVGPGCQIEPALLW